MSRLSRRLPVLPALALLVAAGSACGQVPVPEMVRVEPGTFLMGSPEDEPGHDADENQREVTLTRAYLLGRTEVTQALWAD